MGRILALDLGERRVGLALSDPLKILASPLATIEPGSGRDLLRRVLELVSQHEVELIIIGLPLREDGSSGPGCRHAQNMARRLEAQGVEVRLWDERYSTRTAEEALGELGIDKKKQVLRAKREGRIDRAAAAVILQEYLDYGRAES